MNPQLTLQKMIDMGCMHDGRRVIDVVAYIDQMKVEFYRFEKHITEIHTLENSALYGKSDVSQFLKM